MENIPVRTECQGVDGVGVVQSVQMLAVIEIPEHGLGVLAARGTEGAVRRHSDGVQVAGVADVVGLQLAVGQVPHLDILVPSSGHNDGVLVVGREPHAGDPVLVAILLDGVLALGKSVPQLNGLVSGGGHDLPVVVVVVTGPVVATCSSVAGSERSCRRGATVGDGRCRLSSSSGLPA